MLGYSAAEAEGQSIDLIVPDRLRAATVAASNMLLPAGNQTRWSVGRTLARHKDGSELPIELALSMWQDDGVASFGAIIRDLSSRRANEERLDRLAHRDHLTNLPNG